MKYHLDQEHNEISFSSKIIMKKYQITNYEYY